MAVLPRLVTTLARSMYETREMHLEKPVSFTFLLLFLLQPISFIFSADWKVKYVKWYTLQWQLLFYHDRSCFRRARRSQENKIKNTKYPTLFTLQSFPASYLLIHLFSLIGVFILLGYCSLCLYYHSSVLALRSFTSFPYLSVMFMQPRCNACGPTLPILAVGFHSLCVKQFSLFPEQQIWLLRCFLYCSSTPYGREASMGLMFYTSLTVHYEYCLMHLFLTI